MKQGIQHISETPLFKALKEALQEVVKEAEAWAQQYETDGRFKDAAYLYGRIHSDLKREPRLVPSLAAVYEKIGDFPAAELAQEELMQIVFAAGWEATNDERIREVNTISRLFGLFHDRLQVLGSASQDYAKLSITYRAAILDLELLNVTLLDQGLILLNNCDQWTCCSLHIAARKIAPNLALLLLQRQANPNLTDENGATPLHIAVENGTEEVVQLMLDHGADTEIKNNHGNTALLAALSTRRNEAMLSLLIEKGADIEARDSLRRTPLCKAIESNSRDF